MRQFFDGREKRGEAEHQECLSESKDLLERVQAPTMEDCSNRGTMSRAARDFCVFGKQGEEGSVYSSLLKRLIQMKEL